MFKITERQYLIIMRQAQGCYPYETGGILGGKEQTVLGVLPIYNKDLNKPKESYGITTEDLLRGEAFLKKYDLEFLGLYHTHPQGVPFPSDKDLSHGQKYLFIIGLADRYNPELRAYRIEQGEIVPEPIKIISDEGMTVLDIHADKPLLAQNATLLEMQQLSDMIDDIIYGEAKYPKMPPVWEASNFSTMA